MRVPITVDVDDRGRFTVPEPARQALGIDGQRAKLKLDIRVLGPESARGNEATTKVPIDERGRVTIRPASVRGELGIRDQEAILAIEVETTNRIPRNDGDHELE